jgi:hypothetical protein
MADTTNDTQPRPNVSTEPGEKGMADNSATSTQPSPNISTEHQREGDARSPSDTLDRGQDNDTDADSNGQQNVEDRPNVSTVDPSDYPEQQ